MSSQARIDANRENAKKSTGPSSPEGKAASSRNSLQHGLRAEQHVLLDEDPEEYLALVADLYRRFRPIGDGEERIVLRLASNQWRLDRARAMETQIYREGDAIIVSHNPGMPTEVSDAQSQLCGVALMNDCRNNETLQKLQRYEAALDRAIKQCFYQFDVFRKARLESEKAAEMEARKEAEKEAEVPEKPKTSERTQSNAGIAIPANEGGNRG
jgi:hypothetical protein